MSQQKITRTAETTGTTKALSSSLIGASRRASGKQSSASGQSLPVRSTRTQKQIEKIVQKLNAASLNNTRNLRFQVDLKSGKSVIQVIDSETGEIIRQIPPEKLSGYLQADGNLAIRLFDEHT